MSGNGRESEPAARATAIGGEASSYKFRAGLAAALLAISLAGASGAQAAGRVFSEDWESGNTNQWSTDGTHARCTIAQTALDGGTPHSGKSMLECNWNGTVAWNDTNSYSTLELPQGSWNYNSEFFIRFWVRYDTDVDHVYGDKVFRLDPNDKLESFYILPQMNDAGGPAQIYWELINGSPGPEFWGGGTTIGDQKWHKFEIYMKASSTSAGAIKIWIDGNQVMNNANLVTVAGGQKWGPMYLMSNWSSNPGWEHDANNHVYWDDIEVYTDSGSGATGSMTDASISSGSTAPSPPPPPAQVLPDAPQILSVQ